MRHIITISKIAIKESLRDKIFWGLLIFLGLFLVFSVYISSLSLDTVARYIINFGMLGISIICLTVSILFGMYSLYREKERNELYVILNRIPRPAYILGRFLGTSYIIIIFSAIAGASIFVLSWIFGHRIAPELFWASYWAVLEFTMLTGVGMVFYAMGVSFTLNSLMLLAVYLVGHSMTEAIQSFIGLGQLGSKTHLALVKFLANILPNFDMFDFRLAIVHGESLPTGQVLLVTFYWFCYLAALLLISSALLKKQDV
ncbi:MAG: hypothetical protein AMJ60_10665 [Desulfobacterales bacterium SG8_35]|nr:MAG: hypothetical protein AMJ60_10665 [Desulfobacterales bacterium SG8_35]